MNNFPPTPEEAEKYVEEAIVRLRQQIEEEKAALQQELLRVDAAYKERIHSAKIDFWERVEPMRRELDALVKAASLKHAYSTVPPIIIDRVTNGNADQ